MSPHAKKTLVFFGAVTSLVITASIWGQARINRDRATHKVARHAEQREQANLSYSGHGKLFLALGDLVFVPEGVAVDRPMGLPVLFPDTGDSALGTGDELEAPAEQLQAFEESMVDEEFELVGLVEMHFDPSNQILSVAAWGDEGEVYAREFDLSLAPSNPSRPFAKYVESYFAYMLTGMGPVSAEPATAPIPAEGDGSGTVAWNPCAANCSCSTSGCSHTQVCGQGEKCKCNCYEPNTCNCWCSSAS